MAPNRNKNKMNSDDAIHPGFHEGQKIRIY